MKQYEFIYNNFNQMKNFIGNMKVSKKDNVLVQIFTGVIEGYFIKKILNEVNELLPQAEIIGATTAGEIYKEKVLTGTTVISLTVFEKTKIKSKLLKNNDNEYELGKNIVKDIVSCDTRVIILFTDGLLTDSNSIIKGIQFANNNVVVCGGKAGDNGYLKKTFVFTKEGIMEKGVAAVSLTGKQLNVTTNQNFGWSAIGKSMTVTHASSNRIYTIDNVKAVDIYKKYLGDQVTSGLPKSATEFPLILTRNGTQIARDAFCCYDDGSLSFLGDVQVNDKVQFGYGNVIMLIEQSIEIADKLKNNNIEAIFVYSCSVRRSFMQDKINLEIAPLSNIAQVVGFFTYGEFATFNNSNELLNVSMTILGISEGEKSNDRNEIELPKKESTQKSFLEGKDFGAIKVLMNLVNQGTKELEETNKILEEQNFKIEQMNSITNSIIKITSEILVSGKIEGLFQMMLDKVLSIIPNCKIGSVLLIENNRLCYKATKGYKLDKIKDISYTIDDFSKDFTCNVQNLYKPIIIGDIEKQVFGSADKYNSWKSKICYPVRELLTCCIGIDGKIKGILNIFNTNKEKDFSEQDKDLVKYLCSQIGIALKNSELLEHILYMSRYDSTTNVYNRNYFRELLNITIEEAKLSNEIFVIGVLDLNNLKSINDTYGHDAGDKILKKFANVFKMKINKNDIFARTGGDEFTGIFIKKNIIQVMDIINEIKIEFKNQLVDIQGEKIQISFAYGLSEFGNDSKYEDTLLKIADIRMYERKKSMKENVDKL